MQIWNSPEFLVFLIKEKVGTFKVFFLLWHQNSQSSYICEYDSVVQKEICNVSKKGILGFIYSISNVKIKWLQKQ